MTGTAVYLGVGDLAKRWNYTPKGIRNLLANEVDFPVPVGLINGRYHIWTIEQVKAWEEAHPETQSIEAKRSKMLRPVTFRRQNGSPRSHCCDIANKQFETA